MDTPHRSPDREARETEDQNGLEEIERPADDPQTRPAIDPELSLAERRIPEDS